MSVPKRVPAKWAGFLHLTPYRKSNSIQGLETAARRGKDAIDLDWRVGIDGALHNTHWERPMMKDGFYDPLAQVPRRTPVEQMTRDQVRRLRTRDGYAINGPRVMLTKAAELGLRVEFEAKDSPGFADPAVWSRLRRIVDETGVEVQVKTISNNGDALTRLKRAKAAMFTTILLPRGSRRIPRSWQPFVDYVRGRVIWTGSHL